MSKTVTTEWRAELSELLYSMTNEAIISDRGNPDTDVCGARAKVFAFCDSMLRAAEQANLIKKNLQAMADRVQYFSMDEDGRIDRFDSESEARDDAEQAIENCLVGGEWHPDTDYIRHGILIDLSKTVAHNTKAAEEDAEVDYYCEYSLVDLPALEVIK